MGGMPKSGRGKVVPMIEWTHDAEATSSTPVHREIPYVWPWREGAPRIRVPTAKRFVIPLLHIPVVLAIEGSLAGKIYELKFSKHDLHDRKKFLYFKPQYYMQVVPIEKYQPLELQF